VSCLHRPLLLELHHQIPCLRVNFGPMYRPANCPSIPRERMASQGARGSAFAHKPLRTCRHSSRKWGALTLQMTTNEIQQMQFAGSAFRDR
jgi:hypothetical protein